jgi:hypothetical protein
LKDDVMGWSDLRQARRRKAGLDTLLKLLVRDCKQGTDQGTGAGSF